MKQLLNKDSVSPDVIKLIEKCLLTGNLGPYNKINILKELIKKGYTQAIPILMELALDKNNEFYVNSIFEEFLDQSSIAPEVLTAAQQFASNPKVNADDRFSLLKKLIKPLP